jgi:hypothetical protein
MIRHIILWKFSDQVKRDGNGDEVIELLRQSAAGMIGKIDGLLSAEIGRNVAGGEYDFVYCAELRDRQALDAYQNHPLHVAHKKLSKPYVSSRLVVDYLR